MKCTRLLPMVLTSTLVAAAASYSVAGDNPAAGANSARPSPGQPTGQQGLAAPNESRQGGGTPQSRSSRSGDGGYSNDSTVHRTGQEKRTNADGSEFRTGQDDGPDNTTYPGD